jgi:hypothetical protein
VCLVPPWRGGKGSDMIDQSDVAASAPREATLTERVAREGLAAGVLGAATVAIWFLILDSVAGHPLRTPTILGTALFRGGEGLGESAGPPVSLEMVVLYSWVHGLVFCVIGGLASRLLAVAERQPNAGFGILLLCVIFEFGFLLVSMLFAEPVLRALTAPAILIGNLLAAGAMGTSGAGIRR